MVMHLPLPDICSLQLIDDVVAERQNGKNAQFFNKIAAEWKSKVQEYIDASGSPKNIQLWPKITPQKNVFLNLYSSPQEGAVQKLAIDSLRDHGLTLCPACGEPGRPNTLDHYLPKAAFPHFCITPLNLFPMCDACQAQKGAKTGDDISPRFFIHPYFDVFVAEQVIELSISPPFDTPTFDLTACAQLTAEQSALVESHVRELGIEQRYAHFFRDQHRRLIRLAARMRETGQNVTNTLETFCATEQDLTKNSWGHVFYAAVLANADVMEYLEKGDLPPLP
ncbi:hypothetical protein O5O45_10060 [Hahella aquimaris]|uniref:hypothetical protein n=1 Tax=Hahella sp. HNIBRBA332 TaxID=3015983 RepID=UPI00273C5B90|nr:hypothetical protein [Hahella sp. HNIBRBA332]WLQ16259.1 hypothetical protein O5O45_10060 [Hahella sp. HNIBRBA332]